MTFCFFLLVLNNRKTLIYNALKGNLDHSSSLSISKLSIRFTNFGSDFSLLKNKSVHAIGIRKTS